MSVEDKKLLREVMRELSRRRNIDASDVRLSVSRAVAYVGGVIRPAVGENLDVKFEIKNIIDGMRRIPGIRDAVVDARFEQSTKK